MLNYFHIRNGIVLKLESTITLSTPTQEKTTSPRHQSNPAAYLQTNLRANQLKLARKAKKVHSLQRVLHPTRRVKATTVATTARKTSNVN